MLLLCSRYEKVVILNVFKTGINAMSFLPVFKVCFWRFQQPSGDSGTRAPRAQPDSSSTIYIGERQLTCFVYLCQHPRSTSPSR